MKEKAYYLCMEIFKKYPMMYKVKSGIYWLGMGIQCRLATDEEVILYEKYYDEVKNVTTNKYEYEEKAIYKLALILLNILNKGNAEFDINKLNETSSKLHDFIYELGEDELDCLFLQVKEFTKAHNCVDYFRYKEKVLDYEKLFETITNKYEVTEK